MITDPWEAVAVLEGGARAQLAAPLAPYAKAFADTYRAGVMAPSVQGARTGASELGYAAVFLKRALTDLRGIWLLLASGYTAQAATLAASAWRGPRSRTLPVMRGRHSPT